MLTSLTDQWSERPARRGSGWGGMRLLDHRDRLVTIERVLVAPRSFDPPDLGDGRATR
jgi:hypothetical protein